MQFRNGVLSFLIIIVLSLALIIIGTIIFIKSKNIVNLTKILGISMVLIGVIMIILSKKVCFGYVKLKENIAAAPMLEAKIPSPVKSVKDVMKTITSLEFRDYGSVNSNGNSSQTDMITEILTGIDPKGSHLEVKVFVFGNEEDAYKSYNSEYKRYGKLYGVMDSGGTDKNRYFITYKNQIRSSAESMYQLIDTYVTYVFFQKGNLIIRLWETKRGDTGSKIGSYISLLSSKLATLK